METVGLWQLAEEQQPYMTAMRRLFHTEPELSGREFKTRETLCKELTDMGIPYTLLPGTGLIAQVKGRLPGPSRLLRSDMDALPLEELPDNPVQAKVCVSRNRGVCHACGHDAHMAMLLGTLRVLSAMREELHGTVSACFEEGEETNCGLPAMMTALDGMKIDECFALHVYSGLEAGKICLTSGPRMAGAVRFDLTFKGRAGHGSRPDLAVNPIIPAAHMVGELDSLLRNRLAADAAVTLGLCQFRAGDTWNVIPESAWLEGTVRCLTAEDRKRIKQRIYELAEGQAASFGGHAELTWYAGPPATNNTPSWTDFAIEAAKEAGLDVVPAPVNLAGEDFAYYQEEIPGVFVLVGRAVLPRHIGEGVALDDEFAHILLVCYWSVVVGDYERWARPLSKGRRAHPRFPSYFLGSG